MNTALVSKWQGCLTVTDEAASMEKKTREGYF